MSALAGCLSKTDRPIDTGVVNRLLWFNAERGPDRTAVHHGRDFVMLHCARHFDRWSRLEQQPAILPDGSVLTFDGRLDNRDDLAAQLHHELRGPATDLAIVAAARQVWKDDAFEKLVGDWSLALWDASKNELLLARDHAGNRPLYYADTATSFYWSTCLETLVATFDLYEAIDDDYVARRLMRRGIPQTTPFAGLDSVPPAHLIRASSTGWARLDRFWRLTPKRLRFSDDRDYAAAFRYLFTDAVRVRLRSDRPVWTELSGGLDSSSIVCTAKALLESKGAETPGLDVASYVFPESPESDESRYIEMVEQWCGLSSRRIDGGDRTGFDYIEDLDLGASGSGNLGIQRDMRAAGDQVLLSGELGDLVGGKNSGHVISLFDHAASLNFWRFFAGAHRFGRRSRTPTANVVARVLISAMGRDPLRPPARSWSDLAGGQRHRKMTDPYGVLALGVLEPHIVQRGLSTPRPTFDLRTFPRSKRFLVAGLEFTLNKHMTTSPERTPQLLVSYPFADRRLLEFVVAVPETVLWRPDMNRACMRMAMTGTLPESIRLRQQKGYAPAALSRFVREQAADALDSLSAFQIVQRRYVQPDAFRRALQSAVNGASAHMNGLRLLFIIEAWLRTVNRRKERRRHGSGVSARAHVV